MSDERIEKAIAAANMLTKEGTAFDFLREYPERIAELEATLRAALVHYNPSTVSEKAVQSRMTEVLNK